VGVPAARLSIHVAGYQILTRRLAGHDDPITGLPTVPMHLAALIGTGFLGAVGHFLLIRAHHYPPSTLLSPFGYSQLLVTIIPGVGVFGELSDPIAFVGIALIASFGLALILSSWR